MRGMKKSDFYSRYYERSAEERSRAFCVLSLGYNRIAARMDYDGFQRRHPRDRRFSDKSGRTLESLVLVHISGGHGSFRSAPSGVMPVPANSIFFVFPGVAHSYRYDDATGWDEEWIEFEPSAALPLLAAAGITPESPLRTFPSLSSVAEAFQSLFDISLRNDPSVSFLVSAAAHRVLAESAAMWRKGDFGTAAGRAVEKMRQLLVQGVSEPRTINESARLAGMSVSRMRDLFRQATGLSPKKYQMRTRLVRAGRLLRETDLPVGTIAAQTGFESIFSFSRRFKKLLGIAPSEYRSQKKR